jgi:arylsulfatase
VLKGEQRKQPEYFISGYTEKFRMFRVGDWKIVRANDEDWELYQMSNDQTELENLADSLPGKVSELYRKYDDIVNQFR